VNVDRLLRFTAEKEESVSLMSKNLWHVGMVSGCDYEGSAYFLRTSRMTCPGKLAVGVLPVEP